MSVTQSEIADELGISRQIVGQALNGHPRVAAATRLRVQRAAARLGYRQDSNRAARELNARRYGKRLRTGIIVIAYTPEFAGESVATTPLMMPIIAGIQARGQEYGCDVLSCAPPTGTELPRIIRNREIDGVIGCMRHDLEPSIAALELPLVSLGCTSDLYPSVLPDAGVGLYDATRHLIGLGHRKIAYLGFQLHFPESRRREEGYRRAMQEPGLTPLVMQHPNIFAGPTIESGRTLAEQLLAMPGDGATPVTGLVCYNDLVAIGAAQVMQERSLNVPADVSVVGCDDVSQGYGFQPLLTSVGFDKVAMAAHAVDVLQALAEIKFGPSDGRAPRDALKLQDDSPAVHWQPTTLVVRDSTSVPRVFAAPRAS